MGFWKKEAPQEQRKTPEFEIPERDQLDVLRHRWLGRLLEVGGDTRGAQLCYDYASLADAYNEAKWQWHASGKTDELWNHRRKTLRDQLRSERVFWRDFQPDVLVDIQNDDDFPWPTDAELLAGA